MSETFQTEQIENPDWYKQVDLSHLSDKAGTFIWSETPKEEEK